MTGEYDRVVCIDTACKMAGAQMEFKWNDVVIESRPGDRYINATQMCKAFGKHFNHWSNTDVAKRFIQAVQDDLNKLNKNMKAVYSSRVKTSKYMKGTWIHPKLATVLAQWIDPMFGLKVAEWIEEWKLIGDNEQRYIHAISNLKPSSTEQLERQVKERLHRKLGGVVEQKTPVGRIDLLTEYEIIEIKEIDNWKHALGQIIAYSMFYPLKQKRIHLFGKSTINKNLITTICNKLNILTTFE